MSSTALTKMFHKALTTQPTSKWNLKNYCNQLSKEIRKRILVVKSGLVYSMGVGLSQMQCDPI